MSSSDPARISPTAHYTGWVWYANGMSHPALATRRGHLMYAAVRPASLLYSTVGRRPGLEEMLVARHRLIDHLLEAEIAAGRVRQVIEIAAGNSPRGFHFAQRHRDAGLRYVEADLPASAARKRRLLDSAGLRGPNHDIAVVDALREDGEGSLAALVARLRPGAGTALITEGLIGYFAVDVVEGMWRRFAGALRALGGGLYLSDLYLDSDANLPVLAFRELLSWFARGQVHLHYRGPAQAEGALLAAGFDEAKVRRPADFPEVALPRPDRKHLVRIVSARVG